jgi:hypothetical protein
VIVGGFVCLTAGVLSWKLGIDSLVMLTYCIDNIKISASLVQYKHGCISFKIFISCYPSAAIYVLAVFFLEN